MEVAHYSQPLPSNPNASAKMVSSVMEQLSQDAKFRRALMADMTEDDDITSTMASSYSGRKSPQRVMAPPSPLRLSPSRTCMTDTDLLRSPSEVLYAVSDKHRHHNNERLADTGSQTIHNDIKRYSQPRNNNHLMARHRASRASSREDLLSDVPSSYRPSNETNGRGLSHSADPYYHTGDDDESFKARIQVTLPDRAYPTERYTNRKPYKTTINTATDNIQYRGVISNLNNGNKHYHKQNAYNRRPESEHYKVPKNKVAVEYYANGVPQRPTSLYSDSSHRMEAPPAAYRHNGQSANGNNRFASTRLVKNADSRTPGRFFNGRELDREGRTLRRSLDGRHRTYSGCSTSPDREGSPERYSKPRPPPRSFSYAQNRSPSTSPTRPPRSRSSPAKEILGNAIRRVNGNHYGSRTIERTPSSQGHSGYQSPMKEIRRVHNDLRRERSTPALKSKYEDPEDRMANFTEYRGEDGEVASADPRHLAKNNPVNRRSSTVTYEPYVSTRSGAHSGQSGDERERGQSLPPGATIDSIRDFYKSAQFKSMYALPPSPSRPAPVLDRAPSASTLNRREHSLGRPARPNRVSISEGEITDDPHRGPTLRNRAKMDPGLHSDTGPPSRRPIPPARKPSTKRQAPSPPGQPRLIRRVISADRDHVNRVPSMSSRRVVSADRGPQQHPPVRKPVGRKTSMGDALDSSFSESEGPVIDQRPWSSVSEEELEFEIDCLTNELDRAPSMTQLSTASSRKRPQSHHSAATTTVIHLHQPRERRGNAILYDKTPTMSYTFIQDRADLDYGRRWTIQSDLDSDYRRELATSGLHHEARGRDGGMAGSTGSIAGINNGTLRRRRHGDRSRSEYDVSPSGRAKSSAREEERRKVLEIEEERLRREREVQMRRNNVVAKSNSRVHRAGLSPPQAGLAPKVPRARHLIEDHESQYSGHSSSSAMRKEGIMPKGPGTNTNGRVIRVKRAPSNARSATNGGLHGSRSTLTRKNLPGSVTSSLNSSESEQGSPGANAPPRSVFLHSACVVDIPTTAEKRNNPPVPRALSAPSREHMMNNSNTKNASGSTAHPQSNLKNSKKISRSISLLTPWKPRNAQRTQEIHYRNSGNMYGKPPRPPPVTRRGQAAMMQRDKKSASSSDLLRDGPHIGAPQDGIPSQEESEPSGMIIGEQRTLGGVSNKPSKVSRSVSMPKDSRLAGWFKKRKRL